MCVCRNVTPHSQLEFKVWTHYTLKADVLLGKATLDLRQALEQHDRKRMTRAHSHSQRLIKRFL